MITENIYDYGHGFGVIKLDSTTQDVFQQNEIQSSSVLDNALKTIVGTNPNGTAKKFDLNDYIKLPEFIVKADNSQWWIIAAIIGGLVLVYNYFKKPKK